MNTSVLVRNTILLAVFFGVFQVFSSQVLGASSEPPRIIRNVGQEAVFMWNITDHHYYHRGLFVAIWGLLNNKFNAFKARFISVDFLDFERFLPDLTSNVSRYKGRADFVGDPINGFFWFKLSNLTLDDTGRYAVRMTDPLDGDTTYFSIDLIVTAIPTFSPSLQKYHYIQEGVRISIHCSAVGPPAPNVTWFQNKSVTMVAKSHGVGSATLKMLNVTRETSGVYECRATNNPNENTVSTKTEIVVMYKPKILEHSLNKNATSCNTSTILLYCMADGIPLPQISWVAPDGHPVTTGYEIIGDGSVSSVLKVVTHGNEDDGLYRCRMENIIGSDEHVFDVVNDYINGSSCDSTQKQKTSATEPKTSCAPVIAVCVTVIILLLILNVVQFVITRKKFKAKDETLEMDLDIRRKDQRTTSTDKALYENVSGRSGGVPGTRLGDAHDQQQADSQRFHGDRRRTTPKTSNGTGPVSSQDANDTQVYATLGDRDPTPVYQKLSLGAGKNKSRV